MQEETPEGSEAERDELDESDDDDDETVVRNQRISRGVASRLSLEKHHRSRRSSSNRFAAPPEDAEDDCSSFGKLAQAIRRCTFIKNGFPDFDEMQNWIEVCIPFGVG